MWNTYGMSEIYPITSTSCKKMTGTGVYHVEHPDWLIDYIVF